MHRELHTKRGEGVGATIVTKRVSDALKVDIERHNRQYNFWGFRSTLHVSPNGAPRNPHQQFNKSTIQQFNKKSYLCPLI